MPETNCGFIDAPGGVSGSVLLEAHGPTIQVDIGFDPAYQLNQPGSKPIPGMTGIHALVDTGAMESCIDSMLATQLNLPIVDRRPVSGVHGTLDVNMYLAQVHFPTLSFTIHGAFAGVHLLAGGQIHMALIGRTFLRHCTMVYQGRTGAVIISVP